MIKKDYKGSFTVEAAFVMPIVILSIFSIIYLGFYLHDICKIHGVMNNNLFRSTLVLKHNVDLETGKINYRNINRKMLYSSFAFNGREVEGLIKNNIEKDLKDSLFLIEVPEVNVTVKANHITVLVKVQSGIAQTTLGKFIQPKTNRWIEGKGVIHHPTEFIRIAEVIIDTGEKIKGVEDMKSMLFDAIGNNKR